jgi:hypothetical protein
MLKAIFLTFTVAILAINSGCSVRTNLKEYLPKKVQRNIRSSVVETYSRDEIWKYNATNLGSIEADYCQVKLTDRFPPESELKKTLKVKVQKLGGNVIVYDSCLHTVDRMGCHNHLQCFAFGYAISN